MRTSPKMKIPKKSVRDFILWGSKINEDGDCSHEIKRRLLLGGKAIKYLEILFICILSLLIVDLQTLGFP